MNLLVLRINFGYSTTHFNSLFWKNLLVRIYCSLYSSLFGRKSTYDSQLILIYACNDVFINIRLYTYVCMQWCIHIYLYIYICMSQWCIPIVFIYIYICIFVWILRVCEWSTDATSSLSCIDTYVITHLIMYMHNDLYVYHVWIYMFMCWYVYLYVCVYICI